MKSSLPKLPDKSDPGQFVLPYYSEGEFSMHELIEHVLLHYNEAALVRISSFSITENAVRTFMRLKEQNIIADLTLLLDNNVQRHKLMMLFFGLNVANEIRLTKNHSKIVLIHYMNRLITIVSSANLNINDKIEAGVITNSIPMWDYFSGKLQNSWDKAQKIDIHAFA
jgi:hypothetical protein